MAWPPGEALAQPIVLEVAEAMARFDAQQGAPVVDIRLTLPSRRLFADFTTRQVGKFIEIRVDGHVGVKPHILTPIFGGVFWLPLPGNATLEEAKEMASRLSSGAARLEVEAASE
jgi:preprotein translocase subunit SecD